MELHSLLLNTLRSHRTLVHSTATPTHLFVPRLPLSNKRTSDTQVSQRSPLVPLPARQGITSFALSLPLFNKLFNKRTFWFRFLPCRASQALLSLSLRAELACLQSAIFSRENLASCEASSLQSTIPSSIYRVFSRIRRFLARKRA